MRAIWRLPDGHCITRTVRLEVPGDPEDEERALVVLHELLEELRAAGYEFPEGHGILEQVLGATTGLGATIGCGRLRRQQSIIQRPDCL